MPRQTCLVTDMWLFKKKCKHEHYEEIGRFYFEKGYANVDQLFAIRVIKCSDCGEILFRCCYSHSFLPNNRVDKIQDSVKSLENAGFLKKVDFQAQNVEIKLPDWTNGWN